MQNQKYILNKNIKTAVTDTELYIMNNGEYYVLNVTGKLIYTYLLSGMTSHEIIDKLYTVYSSEVERSELENDCELEINALIDSNIITEVINV